MAMQVMAEMAAIVEMEVLLPDQTGLQALKEIRDNLVLKGMMEKSISMIGMAGLNFKQKIPLDNILNKG